MYCLDVTYNEPLCNRLHCTQKLHKLQRLFSQQLLALLRENDKKKPRKIEIYDSTSHRINASFQLNLPIFIHWTRTTKSTGKRCDRSFTQCCMHVIDNVKWIIFHDVHSCNCLCMWLMNIYPIEFHIIQLVKPIILVLFRKESKKERARENVGRKHREPSI